MKRKCPELGKNPLTKDNETVITLHKGNAEPRELFGAFNKN